MSSRPAFSAAFTAEELRMLEPLLPVEDITPEWAWGGTTGRGVKVAIVDSGVDGDHPVIGGRVAGYVDVTIASDGDILLDDSPTRTHPGTGRRARGSSSASRPSASCTACV